MNRSRSQETKNLLALLVLVFAARLLVMAAIHWWSVSVGRNGLAPIIVGGDDGDYYYETALAVSAGKPYFLTNAFPYLMGKTMAYTGITSTMFYKLIASLAGCAIIWCSVSLLRLMLDKGAGSDKPRSSWPAVRDMVILFAVYPSALFFESFSLWRDAYVYLFHFCTVGALTALLWRWGTVSKLKAGGAALVLFVTLGLFRWYAPLSILLGLGIWLVCRCCWSFRSRVAAAAAVLTLCAGVAAVLVVLQVKGIGPGAEGYEALLLYRSVSQSNDIAGGSNLMIDYSGCSGASFIPLYAYSLISNTIGPFPWQARGSTTAMTSITEVPFLLLVVWRLWSLRRFRDSISIHLLCQALAWFLVIAYFNDNLGTAARLRVLGWHCLFVCYGYWMCKAAALKARPVPTTSDA